jgi:hypothetical protein
MPLPQPDLTAAIVNPMADLEILKDPAYMAENKRAVAKIV